MGSAGNIMYWQELVDRGQVVQAKETILEVLKRCPSNIDALKMMVRISRRERNRHNVLTYVRRVLSIEPDAIFEGTLHSLLTTGNDFAAEESRIKRILATASQKSLAANEADLLMRVIQRSSAGSKRIDFLKQVQCLLDNEIADAQSTMLQESVIAAELSFALGNFEDLERRVNVLKDICAGTHFSSRIGSLSYVSEKVNSPHFPDFNAEKVFCIGLSRTGTSSLNQALKSLGYNSIHWLNPITRDVIRSSDFPIFDAFSDICVSYQFEWLYYAYPNAKFVQTTRNVDSWTKSVSNHYLRQHDIRTPSQLENSSFKKRFRSLAGQVEASVYGRYASWKEAYEDFDIRVETFFRDKPTEKLLKISVTEGQGYEALCPFLDKPTPSFKFPNLNGSEIHTQTTEMSPK